MFKRTLYSGFLPVTIIEIRPYRNGWKCFEAPGVEPVFLNQKQAIGYAKLLRVVILLSDSVRAAIGSRLLIGKAGGQNGWGCLSTLFPCLSALVQLADSTSVLHPA
jgi:hypothetical protein